MILDPRGEAIELCLMRELKTTQKMRHEKVILAIVLLAVAAALWLIMVK